MREFNVAGICVPDLHYMADVGEKIAEIAQLVENGKYFSINRGRQYGKTTTLRLLAKHLAPKYTVISLSFEVTSEIMFESETGFCQKFLEKCAKYFTERKLNGADDWIDESVKTFEDLDSFLDNICKKKDFVLMIDEVDKSSNNFLFLKFLGILRDKYLKRAEKIGATFQSVILAGVYDIKNLKVRMVRAGIHELKDGEKRLNSPWNIAVNFTVDMSLSAKEIASMLTEYENDRKAGIDAEKIAQEIRKYTSGYPYLVSRICQCLEASKNWTLAGIQEAVKIILQEKSALIDDLGKNIDGNKELADLLYDIVVNGNTYEYNIADSAIDLGVTFGFLRNQDGQAVIDNLVFEAVIYSCFSIEKKRKGISINRVLPSDIIESGKFDMELCARKFAEHYYELFKKSGKTFLEDECRMLFLTYLKPLINGKGFYHIESETRNARRMDIVVDYFTEQFIVELKLWYGESAHEKAYGQLYDYLESNNKDAGFLITFDFRNSENIGKPQFKWVEYNGKKIFDLIVGY